MNNKRSPLEQFLLIALLGFAAFTLSQQFFGPGKKQNQVAERKAPALSKAFDGLNAATSEADKKDALAQVAQLQGEIKSNSSDEYAAWAHLRVGLLQQYVLQNATLAAEEYDVVIKRNKHEAVDAQALYQKGNLLWRQAEYGKTNQPTAPPAGSSAAANTATGNSVTAGENSTTGETSLNATQIGDLKKNAIYALEQIPNRGRGDKSFLEKKIFVPDLSYFSGNPLIAPARWEEMSLAQLRGELHSPDPRTVLNRIDTYYSTTPLYIILDTVVKWFGAQPAYSYGLALLLLAVVTRTLMQPFIKKQYDSMKGMSVIAPEMKKIQEKYKGKTDPETQRKMMQEIRTLQKAHGVNPMGCGLSMLIQMPVFFFFVLPLIQHYQAHFELSGAHFGWVQSLARPDIPLLVLYAISMFISVRLSSVPPTDEQQKQMQKMTTLMSPMFAIVLWSYASAFILYWLAYNVLSMFFQWRMMKKSEPEKNLVKTLMGTAQPAVALAGAGAPAAGGALPSRPKGEKTKSESAKSSKAEVIKSEATSSKRKEVTFETNPAALDATPDNGVSGKGISKNGAAKSGAGNGSGSGSGSQRDRRRRR